MKKSLLLCALLSVSSVFAANTSITTIINPGTSAVEVVEGFSDSTFDYSGEFKVENKSFCYNGEVLGVCKIIDRVATVMGQEYRMGAHDNMDSVVCNIEDKTVKASYELYDDYGTHLQVNRLIDACK